MQAFAAAKLRGGCMKKNLDRIMRLCAGAGGVLAVLIIGCAAVFALSTLLFENVQAAETFSGTSALLPKALEMTGFTLTTSLAAVLLVFPIAWSISVMVVFVMHAKHLMPMTRAISGFSAIPAVVFGYMGLTFLAPKAPSAWLGVTATLVLMSLMDLTLLLIRVHVKHLPALESSQALGAFRLLRPFSWAYGRAALRAFLPSPPLRQYAPLCGQSRDLPPQRCAPLRPSPACRTSPDSSPASRSAPCLCISSLFPHKAAGYISPPRRFRRRSPSQIRLLSYRGTAFLSTIPPQCAEAARHRSARPR